jgi:hypothetical protein
MTTLTTSGFQHPDVTYTGGSCGVASREEEKTGQIVIDTDVDLSVFTTRS